MSRDKRAKVLSDLPVGRFSIKSQAVTSVWEWLTQVAILFVYPNMTMGLKRNIQHQLELFAVILGRDIGSGYRGTMSWCDLNLTFNLAVVTSSWKILSGLCLGNHKV